MIVIKKIQAVILFGVFAISFLEVSAQEKLYTNEFPLENVTLLDGKFKNARDLNMSVLLEYDVDRLLAPYRKEAGLEPRKPSYPNWEGLDGHIGGHYLSALAMNYAATDSQEFLARMNYMLKELQECQLTNAKKHAEWGVGYVGGFPNSAALWSSFKKGNFAKYNSAWAPFYNLHKMYAGLRDAWLYADSEQAKEMFLDFCDWGIVLIEDLSHEQMQSVLNMEHGGMPEVYADAYQITGEKKYLEAAKRYSHEQVLNPLSKGIDNLDNKHANTQIPKFVGFERIAEMDGDEKFAKAGSYFWETVTKNRSIAFGGNSRKEHFPSKSASIDYINEDDGPESCNSYNMLKLAEDLFRVNPEAKYADYYERTLYNHILSTQHPQHGGYVYFTPARPRHYRIYSAPEEAMWCCVGTGMENHGKYNQFIYTHQGDSLYVNLFIPSELNWEKQGVKIKQETNFPSEEGTKLKITKGTAEFPLFVRYPGWVKEGEMKIKVNSEEIKIMGKPSSYVKIDRNWQKGDIVEVNLPMHNRIEKLPNVPQYVAFFHGPVLLGAPSGTEDLRGLIADDSRFGQYPSGRRLPINEAPILLVDHIEELPESLESIENEPLHFRINAEMKNQIDADLQPFYTIHDSRYIMYWLALTPEEYGSYTDSLANIEAKKLALEQRTIDYVATGEQQPESDHFMEKENSGTGNNRDEFWRSAHVDGYFSYKMKTKKETGLSLMLRYFGFEWGDKRFDIYIDDEKLNSVNTKEHTRISQFQEMSYEIPDSMLEGKNSIRVKFQPREGSATSEIYFVRLVRNQ
ncbi:glycoside hydrolase family 127 protein [Zunongwangia endophytica]|uniref:Beta-L-arabinofuranosidase domain-containing protein n=1 Tax=Zunongwangia endophytica TaxID=1808945 RepID=A0ABV8H4T7_9FLAO|nr:glycoside hydrolase family 127 protein [Zunongwangia endophytica]MDN3594432.1 glycoside hydrolase family 127 protein [Zunongwangia endophytica]